MGWWSPTILGGDPPLDMLCALDRALGLDDRLALADLGRLSRSDRRLFAAALDSWRGDDGWGVRIADLADSSHDDAWLAAQVLAVVVMAVGADMDDELREAAATSGDHDPWVQQEAATGGGPRTKAVAEFAELVRFYAGKPTGVWAESLLDALRRVAGG